MLLEISKKYLTTERSGEGTTLCIGATAVVVIVYVIHSSNTNNINIATEHALYMQTGTPISCQYQIFTKITHF